MSNDLETENGDQDAIQSQLVAYLDGELGPDASREIERRLSENPELRRRLQEHQQTWDLLDEVPRTEVGDAFTQTTVEMVVVSAADDVRQLKGQTTHQRRLLWSLCAAGLIVACVAAFLVTRSILDLPDRQLVDDLPIIENLDAYRNAESVDFLRALEREGLFTTEVEDAL